MKQLTRPACVMAVGLVVCQPALQAAELRVLCSNGLRAVVEAVTPEFEKASGHRLVLDFSSTATLSRRIENGEAFDMALLTTDAVEVLIRSGRLVSSTRVELARSGIGVGFRRGQRRPDVSSPEALRRSLLAAGSIVYTRDGASRPAIDRMLEALAVSAAVEPKTRLLGPGEGPLWVAKGEAEIVMTLMSEILPVSGVELAGPFPQEFQHYVTFAAAASSGVRDREAVGAFIAFLSRPEHAGIYRAQGMDQGQTP